MITLTACQPRSSCSTNVNTIHLFIGRSFTNSPLLPANKVKNYDLTLLDRSLSKDYLTLVVIYFLRLRPLIQNNDHMTLIDRWSTNTASPPSASSWACWRAPSWPSSLSSLSTSCDVAVSAAGNAASGHVSKTAIIRWVECDVFSFDHVILGCHVTSF